VTEKLKDQITQHLQVIVTAIFEMNFGLADNFSVFFCQVFFTFVLHRFYLWTWCLFITQRTMSKHWKKLKALIATNCLVSTFLNPPADCWWKGCCFL